MRVIVRCAGPGERWGNHLGVPKHLAPLCGETVLGRIVRLCNVHAPDADVKVVVDSLKDARYKIPGSSRSVDKPTPGNGDLDKIVSSRHLFDRKDRTVLLWGDTWWEERSLADVLGARHPEPHAWLRFGPGGIGGEVFAFSWPASANATVNDALDRALEAHRAGLLDTAGYNGEPLRGGWALYRSLAGAEWDDHSNHGGCTVVDGWTEDMDTPADWDGWCLRHALTDPEDRPT